MFSIEIHVDNLEDKDASVRTSLVKKDAKFWQKIISELLARYLKDSEIKTDE